MLGILPSPPKTLPSPYFLFSTFRRKQIWQVLQMRNLIKSNNKFGNCKSTRGITFCCVFNYIILLATNLKDRNNCLLATVEMFHYCLSNGFRYNLCLLRTSSVTSFPFGLILFPHTPFLFFLFISSSYYYFYTSQSRFCFRPADAVPRSRSVREFSAKS